MFEKYDNGEKFFFFSLDFSYATNSTERNRGHTSNNDGKVKTIRNQEESMLADKQNSVENQTFV